MLFIFCTKKKELGLKVYPVISNLSLSCNSEISVLTYKTDVGLVLNPKNCLLFTKELASCNAKNDLPTFGSATKQYNPFDFIIPSIMLSFWYYKSVIINYRNAVDCYTSFYYDESDWITKVF